MPNTYAYKVLREVGPLSFVVRKRALGVACSCRGCHTKPVAEDGASDYGDILAPCSSAWVWTWLGCAVHAEGCEA